MSLLHPNFYYERFMEVVVSSYYEFQAISNPDDLIHYNALKATSLSLLQNSPWALFSGLFRPFITEASTAFQWFIAFENLVLLIFTAGALDTGKKINQEPASCSSLLNCHVFNLCCAFSWLCQHPTSERSHGTGWDFYLI